MGQAPFPFAVAQDGTCATNDNENACIKFLNESLYKRKFTLHVLMNVGQGNFRDEKTVIVQKISQKYPYEDIKKLVWYSRVPIAFQKIPGKILE